MHITNKEMMKTTIIVLPRLVMKNKHVLRFIKEIFVDINKDKIVDKEELILLSLIEKALSAINLGIKGKEAYINYISDKSYGKLMEELNSRILHEEHNEDFLDELMTYYGSISFNKAILDQKEPLIEALTTYSLDGIYEGNNSFKRMRDILTRITTDMQDKTLYEDDKELMVDDDNTVGLSETIVDLKNEEAFRIYSGGATDIIFGGYAPNRAYGDAAISGGFKSGFLLNEVCAIKDNPRNKIPDEILEGSKPVIVLYILENTLIQTYRRILAYLGYTKADVDNMSNEDLTRIGWKYLSPSPNGIRMMIKQLPADTLDKTYMINFTADLKRRGYKVILHAVDYIDKMKVNLSQGDLASKKIPIVKSASDLKAVSIATFAPVLTSAQFNRQAIMAIEDAFAKGLLDPVRKLHLGYIASGYAMVCEMDGFLIHYKGKVGDTNFMSFKSAKSRDGEDNFKQVVVSKFDETGFKICSETVDSVEDLFTNLNDINSIISDINANMANIGGLYSDTLGSEPPIVENSM